MTTDIVVQSRPVGSWTVVDVEGEVDLFTAPKLRERLIELIEEGKTHIVVNLEPVEFIDSTGLGVLVGGLKRVKEREGTFALVCTTRPVLRVLSVTGLDKVFPVYSSLEQATASSG